MLVDFQEIRESGDEWEAFTRDFLVTLGFAVETPPGRGADGGRDLLVAEHLEGRLSRYPFRWLVSCKHRAHGGRSVGESDEQNILERLHAVGAEGFMGVYSTLPSAALVERLRALLDQRKIRDYKIFDARLIENHLVRLGYSRLLLRFFPDSYKRLKPLHTITDEFIPLKCRKCDKELLESVADGGGLVAIVRPRGEDQWHRVVDVYWACKGECDHALRQDLRVQGLETGWEDLLDLTIPAWYLRWVLGVMNRIRDGKDDYTDEAYSRIKELIIALAQRVVREMTEEETERVGKMLSFSGL